MKKTVVLAYSGGERSAAGIGWLAERHRADVVTVTLDLGESHEVADMRRRAMDEGAVRAHVLDVRDEFVREYVMPSLKAGAVADGRYEIGSTWLHPGWQRTAANTEAKYLMLRHAFEALGARRVELKTHVLNEKSRSAIERLGAVYEGMHRNHMVMPDGSMRDTVWYSVIDTEWPAVKARLEARLEARGA